MVLACVKPRLLEIRTAQPRTARGLREAGHRNDVILLISHEETLHKEMLIGMVKISQLIHSLHCKICCWEKADH